MTKFLNSIRVMASLTLILSLSIQADWKVLLYIDSSDGLSDMAIKNITDIMRGQPDNHIDFMIQLHAYYTTALRYRVTGNTITFIEEVHLGNNSKEDFLDAARWAFNNIREDDKTLLILGGHGWGILDPQWNIEAQEWQAGNECLNNLCTTKNLPYRGFVFNLDPRTYLTNQDLVESLTYIKETLLKNRPLDVIAFDTCMGDVFEVGYQLAPYVNYLVGSQSCSLKDGFDYHALIPLLNRNLTPGILVTQMVKAFDAYYNKHDASGIYTHAALDLSKVFQVSKALDKIVMQLLNIPESIPLIREARNTTPRFCLWPMYTDLIAFLKKIEEKIGSLPLSNDIILLKESLKNFYRTIDPLIVARCGGLATREQAHGVAIYLPLQDIYQPYYTTIFARETCWIKLLEALSYSD